MRRALLLLLLLCLPASVRAMWVTVPVEALVQGSDLIVVGTLRGVREHTADDVDYGEGRIEVREVIWGAASPRDSLPLKWENPSAISCPRVEHRGHADVEGIWLLTRDGGHVRADYPGRFVKLSERGRVEEALARSPIVLRASGYLVGPDEPMKFSVVYRNATAAPLDLPAVAYSPDDRPKLISGARFAVEVAGDGEPRPARVISRQPPPGRPEPVALAPGEERSFEFDLREWLESAPKSGESYTVRLAPRGLRPTNAVTFYVGGPEFPRAAAEPPPAPPGKEIEVFTAPAASRGLSPLVRAELAALAALVFFPLFYRLRANLAEARLARILNGAQRWQI